MFVLLLIIDRGDGPADVNLPRGAAMALGRAPGPGAGRRVLERPDPLVESIKASRQRLHWAPALGALEEVRRRGLELELSVLHACVGACERAALWERSLAALREAASCGLRLNTFSHDSAVGGAARRGAWREAEEVLQGARRVGLRPSVVSHSARLATPRERSPHWLLALRIARQVARGGVKSDIVFANAAVTALSRGAEWRRALDLSHGARLDGLMNI